MTIYTTDADKHSNKQNYYYNEYRTVDGNIIKYRCHRHRNVGGGESGWSTDEEQIDFWTFDDPKLPDIIKEHMIELNRRLYMNRQGEIHSGYSRIKAEIGELMNALECSR